VRQIESGLTKVNCIHFVSRQLPKTKLANIFATRQKSKVK